MTDNPRVELAARALARYRLGQHALARSLHSDTARSILDQAAEKLWPSLLDEATAIVEALDGTQSPTEAAGDMTSLPPASAELKEGSEERISRDLDRGEQEGDHERKRAERQASTNNRRLVEEPDDGLSNPLGRSNL